MVNCWRLPVQVQNGGQNIDEGMLLQLLDYEHNMGKCLQVLTDQKKILRQENVGLKDQITKLPSILQLELDSVREDVMSKMHTISYQVGELIRTYTQFVTDTSAVSYPTRYDPLMYRNEGAVHATNSVIPLLETGKGFVDSAIKEESKPLLKFEEVVVGEQNERALVEPIAAPENNAVAPFLLARFQQHAQKLNKREEKVSLIRIDNATLQKQIEALKSGAQNAEREFRSHIWETSAGNCEAQLIVLRICSIPKSIKDANHLAATATRERDINQIKGYVERCKVMQADILALSEAVDEVAKAIKGGN